MLSILWLSEVVPDPDSGAGGTELRMVDELRALGHRVDTVWAGDLPRRIGHGNLHYAFELPRTYARAMRERCAEDDYDIVTFNLGQGYRGAEQLKRSGFSGAVIGRSHGLDDHLNETLEAWRDRLGQPRRPWWKQRVSEVMARSTARHLRLASRWSDGYVVSNSLDAAYLRERHGLAAENVCRLPQAASPEFLDRPAPAMSEERRQRLLYVAGFHYAKGPRAAAQAASELLAENRERSMTWICHEDDHSRVRELFDREVLGRVTLLGWMPQAELIEQFDRHGIFLYPSLFDGFGKVFLEAMARGLCVVGGRAGGMVDLIEDGVNGFLCGPDDAPAIADAVRRLDREPDLAAAISERAAATARDYSWPRVGRELAEFLKKRLRAVKSESMPMTS